MTVYIGTSGNDANPDRSTEDFLYGGPGEDFLYSQVSGFDYWDGGDGNDTLITLWSASLGWGNFYGGDGDDLIQAGNTTQNEILEGGAGNDIIQDGGRQGDVTQAGTGFIYGGSGTDALFGLAGDDYIYGGDGNDNAVTITAGAAGHTEGAIAGLYGGDGNDYLDGGQGNDAMYGGAGNDTIIANSGVDTAFGGDGTDNIYGGRYILTTERMTAEGGNGNDFIFAGDNIDVLYGDNAAGTETGNDFIWAGGGNDYLIGGNGTDTLIGNDGSDFFYGGAGQDWFDLAYDVRGGDSDYLLDFQAGVDYVLMHKSNQNDVTFGVSGGYAYGYISEGSGSYLFLAAGLTAAQLQAATLFVI
jgi:Ca2+-binding RTX toxin-like protein